MAGAKSGKFAVVGSTSTTQGWTINETNSLNKFSTSNLKCGTARKKGVFDWVGTYKGLGGLPPHLPGETVAFTGYLGPTDEVSGVGQTVSGNIIILSSVITWDFQTAAIISWVNNYGGHLAATWGTGTVTDVTDVEAPETYGVDVDNNGTIFDDVTQGVLTLSSDVKTYVNSSTHVGGKCWTGRKAGIIDWTYALSQECSDRDQAGGLDGAPAIGSTDNYLKLFVDGTDYWGLKWGAVAGYSGLSADNDSGDIIARTINFEKNGWDEGTTSLGEIFTPGELVTPWWPK